MRTSNRSHNTIRALNFIGPTYVTPPASETAPDSIESSDHPNGRLSTLQPQPITISLVISTKLSRGTSLPSKGDYYQFASTASNQPPAPLRHRQDPSYLIQAISSARRLQDIPEYHIACNPTTRHQTNFCSTTTSFRQRISALLNPYDIY